MLRDHQKRLHPLRLTQFVQGDICRAEDTLADWQRSSGRDGRPTVDQVLVEAGGLVGLLGADRAQRSALYDAVGLVVEYLRDTSNQDERVRVAV